MKRIIAWMLVLLCCFSGLTIAFGEEKNTERSGVQEVKGLMENNANAKIYSEYDYIVAVRSEKNAREKYSLTKESYERLISNEIEAELLYRASLPDSVLKSYYCYTDSQIAVIKEYDGSRIDDVPEMRTVMAELTVHMGELVKTKTRMGVIYTWTWSVKPTSHTTEGAAMTWDATYENGLTNEMEFDDATSFAQVHYHSTDGQEVTYYPLEAEDSVLCGVSTQFPMDKRFGLVWHWAKGGAMYVYTDLVNQSSGPRIFEYVAHGEYASHPQKVNLGITIGKILGVTYSSGVTVTGEIDVFFRP